MSRRAFRWGWLLLIVPAIFGLTRLRFDAEALNLLPGELPVVQGLKLYEQHFTGVRELVLTLRAENSESAESAARQLAEALRRETNFVADVHWQPPLAEHREQLAEFIAYLWLNQSPAAFAELTHRLAPERLNEALRDTREQLATTLSPLDLARLSYDPFGFTRLPETGMAGGTLVEESAEDFASADGTFRVMFVEANADLAGFRRCAAWLRHVKAVVNRCETSTDWPGPVMVRFTGAPVFVTEVAGGMERDIRTSALCSVVLIAALFWWAHRSGRPLLWLLAMLGLIVAGALAAGGAVFGKLNAVSLGFAAILAGLAVDYGLVLYQEWTRSPHLTARDVRRIHAPGIGWSAVTTASAFALLNFAGLPGLSQLGSLVAIGVLLAAVVMLFVFLPIIACRPPEDSPASISPAGDSASRVSPELQIPNPVEQTCPFPVGPTCRSALPETGGSALPETDRSDVRVTGYGGPPTLALVATVVIAIAATWLLWRAWPQVDHGTQALQPRHSAAQIALEEMQAELNQQGEPLLLVVAGRNEEEVAHRLDAVRARLSRAMADRVVLGFQLPIALWPHPERQRTNLAAGLALARRADAIKAAVTQAGFTPEAMTFAENVFRAWKHAADTTGPVWPASRAAQWTLQRAIAHDGEQWLAAGAVHPGTNALAVATFARLTFESPGLWLTSWTLLGEALLQHVENRLRWVVAGMMLAMTLCLWLAFRRWTEVVLSFGTLGFGLLLLLAVMSLAGWSWNLMNLMAVPILLGAGVDYTIHIQRALRRHAGDIALVRSGTGRAVLLCAATTGVGFGSNGFASNAGLASLGLVCATGIAAMFCAAFFLLPAWWRRFSLKNTIEPGKNPDGHGLEGFVPSPTPSTLYRAGVWSFGLAVIRWLPPTVRVGLSRGLGTLYWLIQFKRRGIVMQNLRPVLEGNRAAAARAARRLFQQFAVKIGDLWRFESGEAVDHWLKDWSGWEHFAAAQGRGRGVLIVTPHLGNWEFGGAFLAARGFKLLVLTQPEPGAGFTELRQKSRARWGIETLVVGEDAFAFVEIIKRLQAGATVALLVDRPPPATAVTVELFGRPFRASIAAAELARASGCAILPTFVVRQGGGYQAHVLPEIHYDRAKIGDRAARIRLTQEILRAFEPAIRQHVEQWYHFVPVWP